MARRPRTFRVLAVMVTALALVALVAFPASAGPRVNCAATGVADFSQNTDGSWNWTIAGAGLCVDTLQGPYQASLFGTGKSDSLGLCGGLVVRNLALSVNVNIFNIRTLSNQNFTENWGAALSTFPIATPFTASRGTVGVIFSHILIKCPPGGTRSAVFVWSQNT